MLWPWREAKTTADGRSKRHDAPPYVAKGMDSDPQANGLLSGEPSTVDRLAIGNGGKSTSPPPSAVEQGRRHP